MSMDFNDLWMAANDLAEDALLSAGEYRPEALGLDHRAAHTIHVGTGFLAVTREADRTLQYYGGFEYVDREHRLQLGDWVFYSADSDRVQGCIERISDEG